MPGSQRFPSFILIWWKPCRMTPVPSPNNPVGTSTPAVGRRMGSLKPWPDQSSRQIPGEQLFHSGKLEEGSICTKANLLCWWLFCWLIPARMRAPRFSQPRFPFSLTSCHMAGIVWCCHGLPWQWQWWWHVFSIAKFEPNESRCDLELSSPKSKPGYISTSFLGNRGESP